MLKNNNVIKVISLLSAIVLWIYVIVEENPTVTQKYETLPVQILNEESLKQRGLILIGDSNPTVTVTVEGKRAEVNKITRDDILVSADVFGYSRGENYIPVNVTVPDSVNAVEIKPNKIQLQIDELISIAKTVEVVALDEGLEGKELSDIVVQPEEVMLTGAKSILDGVDSVRAHVSPNEFTSDGNTITSTLLIQNAEGETLENIALSSKTAEISAVLLDKKEVPLNIEILGEIDPNYAATAINVPDKITIKGKAEDLAGIESVEAKPIDISYVISTVRIPIEPILPSEIRISDESKDINVYIVVNTASAAEFNVDTGKIEIDGLAIGKRYSIDEQANYTLTVSGAETLMKGASLDDFRFVVNLDGLGNGTHIVPIEVEYTKAYTKVTITPNEMQITINGGQ